MTNEEYLLLFQTNDRPGNWEYPPGMDYKEQVARFRRFVAELEPRLDKKLEIQTESHIQDASFHSQVMLTGSFLRFSNFGDMIATTDDESVDPSTLEVVKVLAQEHGYTFIPEALLHTKYTGDAGNTGIDSWWIRYFDWL